jgi:phosphoribosylformylglycinamidine synthase
MGIVGLLKTAPPVTIPFKEVGRAVLLLGGLGTTEATRFGGTQYAKVVLDKMWGLPPALDMDYEKRVHTAIREVIAQGLAESSHDLGDGGLAVALAECCAEGTGASISLDTELRPEFALFHEAPSRILLSTTSPETVEKIAHHNNIECLRLGVTMKEKLQISNGSTTTAALWIDCRVDFLREVWENALESLLNPVPV